MKHICGLNTSHEEVLTGSIQDITKDQNNYFITDSQDKIYLLTENSYFNNEQQTKWKFINAYNFLLKI